MDHLGAKVGVLADRANQELHELTSWGIDDLGILIVLLTEHLHVLAHNELKGQRNDTWDVTIFVLFCLKIMLSYHCSHFVKVKFNKDWILVDADVFNEVLLSSQENVFQLCEVFIDIISIVFFGKEELAWKA